MSLRLVLEMLADLSAEDQERAMAWLATSLRHRHAVPLPELDDTGAELARIAAESARLAEVGADLERRLAELQAEAKASEEETSRIAAALDELEPRRTWPSPDTDKAPPP